MRGLGFCFVLFFVCFFVFVEVVNFNLIAMLIVGLFTPGQFPLIVRFLAHVKSMSSQLGFNVYIQSKLL